MTRPLVPEGSAEVKIRCCYCDIRENCKSRSRKEIYEGLGTITKCIMTPNRPGKKKKK